MAIRIDLTPEKETVLREQAARKGVPVENLAKTLLEESLAEQNITYATGEEWVKAFHEWAEGHDRGIPLLSNEAISRESIYEGRD